MNLKIRYVKPSLRILKQKKHLIDKIEIISTYVLLKA